MRLFRFWRRCLTAGAVLACLATGPLAMASTVLSMDFEEVAGEAELIFQGRVLDIEARRSGSNRVHTRVRLEVQDVLKGNYAGDTIELRYLGGRSGELRLEVTDMQMPATGESGVYFVESLANDLVHPLVGWSQGHYLIETDSGGVQRVSSADSEPVTGFSGNEGRSSAAGPVERGDAAADVITAPLRTPDAAMSVEEFRSAVEDALDAS